MRHRIAGGAVLVAAVASLALAAPFASGSPPLTDLTVKQSAGKATVSRGGTITFTSYGLNIGPATSELDVGWVWSTGLTVTNQTCQMVSADTPSCEWSNVKAHGTRKMVITAKATGPVGSHAALTVCTANPSGTDPTDVNNCSTTFVRITR